MSVLVIVETSNGKLSKAAIEAASYGAQIASLSGDQAVLLSIGDASDDELVKAGNVGISKVLKCDANAVHHFDPQAYAKVALAAVESTGAKTIIFIHDRSGKAVSPRLSAKLKAGLVSGAVSLPDLSSGFVVKKNVFSGKASAQYKINTDVKIISLLANSVPPIQKDGSATVESFNSSLDGYTSPLSIENKVREVSGEIPLPGAELVVSAGRGMKGPENWGMIEDLAKTVGAATACSRPVSDIGWRPHHEHVGQTGIAIRPNLYIAVGISGAIQHLAGVNGSKVIVVINKDPEAPFFKAADYGVVGDAFDVVPKLNEAFRKFKAQNA
ncbi:MAG: electron transfer flavoprotein subunit alpha/FixB family protein [Bacteroidia bacterium]